MKGETLAPDAVAKAFDCYADVLNMYASDQRSFGRLQRTQRGKRECELKAMLYDEIAAEMRAIEWRKQQ